jgi:AbrB family looped-hinge helix DNA binding protein
MSTVSTTKLSSKGQVVIPEDIRKKLNLKTGAQFIVVGDKDVVILKSISPPSLDEFDELISRARDTAQLSGLTKKDIEKAIKKVRSRK